MCMSVNVKGLTCLYLYRSSCIFTLVSKGSLGATEDGIHRMFGLLKGYNSRADVAMLHKVYLYGLLKVIKCGLTWDVL